MWGFSCAETLHIQAARNLVKIQISLVTSIIQTPKFAYPCQGEGIGVVEITFSAISLTAVFPQLGHSTSKYCEVDTSTSDNIPCLQCQHSQITLQTGWLQSSILTC